MKVTTAQQNLSLYGGVTSARAQLIATALRQKGLLPKGGRGPFAPEANAEELAVFLLAVAAAPRIEDAAEVAISVGNLRDRHGFRLVDLIQGAIENPAVAAKIRNIRVLVPSSFAEVTFKTGALEPFARQEQWADSAFVPSAQGAGYAGPIGHIGAAVLIQMAISFSQNSDADEVGELVG